MATSFAEIRPCQSRTGLAGRTPNSDKIAFWKNEFRAWAGAQGLSSAERSFMARAIQAEWAVGSAGTWKNAVKGMQRALEQMHGLGWRLDPVALGYGANLRYGIDLGFKQVINGVMNYATVEAKGYSMIFSNGVINLKSMNVAGVGAYAGDAIWTVDRLQRAAAGGNVNALIYQVAQQQGRLQYFTSFTNRMLQWL